ncbi:MAG: AsmA-like C-terminal region-containing protein, partial [Candidatus Acidiferrales bacterium]
LRAQKVQFAPLEGTNAKAEVRIFTDRMEVWPLSMQLYGGTVGATVRVDLRQQPERFSGGVELKELNVEQLTTAVGAEQKVTGTGEVNLQLAGTLGENLMNSLTGNGNLAVRDGQLPGLNLGSTMQSVAKLQKALNFGAGSAEKFGGSTPFKAITADLSVKGGRVHSQRIHVDSPSGAVEMSGSMGLQDQSLNYEGKAVLMGGQNSEDSDSPIGAITGILGQVTKQNIDRITIPFALRGTVSDPKIQPGRGVPTFTTAPPSGEPRQQNQQPEKKKSILDLFRKPTKPPS